MVRMKEAAAVCSKLDSIMNLSLYGVSSLTKGRSIVFSQDDEGKCTTTVWKSTVYAGVVHSLFNEVEITQGPNGERILTHINCLTSSIWELTKANEDQLKRRKINLAEL